MSRYAILSRFILSPCLQSVQFDMLYRLRRSLQQQLQRHNANRREAELLVSHCRQLQEGEALDQSLQALEEAFKEVGRSSEANERNLQASRVRLLVSFPLWQSLHMFTHMHAFVTDRTPIWNGTTYWLRCKPSGLCYCNICQGSHTFLEQICKTLERFYLQGKSWNAQIFFGNYFWGIHNIFQ